MHARVKLYSFKAISDRVGSGSTTEQYLDNLATCNANMTQAIPHIFEEIENA